MFLIPLMLLKKTWRTTIMGKKKKGFYHAENKKNCCNCSVPISLIDDFDLEYFAEAANKMTMRTTLEYIKIVELKNYRSGKSSFSYLEENYLDPIWVTFPMYKLDVLFDEFQEKSLQLIQVGLCRQYWKQDKIMFDEAVPPLVLSMTDLEIGFIACLMPLSMSVLAFISEVTTPRVRSMAQSIKEKVIAAFIIFSFYNLKACSF